MMIKPQALLLLCNLLLLAPGLCKAQMDDWQLRSQVGLTYSPKKRWNIDAAIRYDRNHNLSAFRRTNMTLGTSYQVKKHLELGMSYRFMTSYQQDVHRFRVYAVTNKKLNKRFSISSRTMLQHDMNYLQPDYLQSYNPKWVLRERIALKYDYSKKIKFTLYSEPFVSYRDAAFNLFRWRNGIQGGYEFKKQHEISGGFFWQHGMAQNAGQNIGVFLIQYTFDLNKPKAKKKKKSP